MRDMLLCMDPKAAIEKLIKAGWNEQRLADRVGCKQPTINRIRRGAVRDCMYSLGVKLVALAAEVQDEHSETPAPSAAEQRAA
jgi:IS30 family transposase